MPESTPATPPPALHRVAVTGVGIVSPMGLGWRDNADGFRVGRLAFQDVTLFDTSRQRVHRAGQIELPENLPSTRLSRRQMTRIDRATALILHAADEAWRQSGWDALGDAEKAAIPTVLGTSAGAMALGEAYYRQATATPVSRRGQAVRVQHYQVQMQGVAVAAAYGLGGSVSLITNACASGANAIGQAFASIRSGRQARVLAGGYDALCELVFAGFDSLQALSTDVPRPFDAQRDGLALGEGAAVLTLESFQSAEARGAAILAEIVGYGACTDGHHLTQPHPEGNAALTSMTRACAQAGIGPAEIDYLNSHGTGTPLNDVAEANAIRRWCEAAQADPAALSVSSTKSTIGHLLGGAGAVEAAICLMALREGFLPVNASLRTPDPAVCFDLVTVPREKRIRTALTNSFGFGGANASLILRQCP